jgi:peptidoglycan/xylan/chitin deacetylase (PgdA/CDA1 family)
MPLPLFCRHLNVIERFCDVVPLSEVSVCIDVGARPRVAVTFDDAYRGATSRALPELARRELPATVFVPPGFVPNGTFWWDDVARVAGGLSDSERAAALLESRGRDDEVRLRYVGRVPGGPPRTDLQCAAVEELRSAVATGLVTLGSHTWSHPNLARATPTELTDELSRPLAWLREYFPNSFVPMISYPYGLESAAVRAAARAAGYSSGFLVTGGWMPARPADPFALPRLNVPAGMSAEGLALRLSGLLA